MKTLLTAAFVLSACWAWAAPTFHVIFDLDWTMAYPTTEAMQLADPKNTIRIGTELYRLSDSAIEVLTVLHQHPDIKVSFYSGGSAERNRQLVEALYQPVQKKLGPQAQPFRILNKEDLLQVATDPNLKFSERFKKDLSKISDPDFAILIDDLKDFAPAGQAKSLLWLGKTYVDRPAFSMAELEDPKSKDYSAPDWSEWKRERLKLVRALGLVLRSRDKALSQKETFSKALQESLLEESTSAWEPLQEGLQAIRVSFGAPQCQRLYRLY